jgi:4-amino-4-deoxy-L-arabinose transferase-like glycosyltransferase
VLSGRKEWLLWLTVLIGATGLRFAPIAASLPYIDYIDEGYALHQAIDLLNRGTLDPGWYGYPSLPAYLTAGSLVAAAPFYRQIHGHSFREDLPRESGRPPGSGYDYDQISPPALILAGRIAAATLSVATVVLAGLIALKLQGRLAGFLALLFTAICPALVLRGSNVLVDTFATFFVLLTLCFCEQFRASKTRVGAWVAASGFASGLALASKYPAGAIFVAVLAGLWMLPVTRRARVRLILVATATLILGILAGAPATIFHWRLVLRDVAVTAANYRIIESNPGYFGLAITSSELGWFVAVAGCVGLALMVRHKATRSTALGWCLFAVTLLTPFLGKPFQPFRNLLPLAPIFCIAAATAFSELIHWARRHGRAAWGLTTATLLVGATVVSSVLASVPPLQRRMAHRDSRLQAIDWLQRHATSDERVLAVRELAILPAEWKRLAASTTVVPWCEALDLLDRDQFDYVVTGDFDTRSAPDPGGASMCLARWKEKNAALPATAQFGAGPTYVAPFIWHTNDERIVILRTGSAKLP